MLDEFQHLDPLRVSESVLFHDGSLFKFLMDLWYPRTHLSTPLEWTPPPVLLRGRGGHDRREGRGDGG